MAECGGGVVCGGEGEEVENMIWDKGLDAKSATFKLASSGSRIIRSIAGPGSGKSFAIKRRIIRLLEAGTKPEKILAVTFTRTSAADLRKEISSIDITGCEKVDARTIHSLALLILHRVEIKTIIEREARMVIEHEIIPALKDIEYPPETSVLDRKKLLETYISAWANTQKDEPGLPKDEIEEEFTNRLIGWLKYHKGMLVGEVIPIALRYLQDNPASPEIGKFEVVLVDEYQDLNRAEQEFVKLLAGDKNIVIVGDDDQSIYSFKNAHPEGIREIGNLYGEYDDIIFNEIRRCPKYVTRLASTLISKNSNRTLGDLIPYSKNQDGIVHIFQWYNNIEEIDGIVKIIKNEIEEKLIKPEDVLVLTPRRIFGYKVRDKLIYNGIAARSCFREDIIKNEKVKYAYSILYLIGFPNDKISLRYLLGYGDSNYRKDQYKKLQEYSDKNNITIREVLDSILQEKINIKNTKAITNRYRTVLNDLANTKRRLLEDPKNVFEYFFDDDTEDYFGEIITLFQDIIFNHPCENGEDDEYLVDWFKRIIIQLSESIATPDIPETVEHVRIMSLHSSKGLSAKFVIMMSMIDDLMPFYRNERGNELKKIIEEQRRLFYVAMTRCKSSENEYPGRLIISSFTSIHVIEAKKIGLETNSKKEKSTQATRFLNDFGMIKPKTILGKDFLKNFENENR